MRESNLGLTARRDLRSRLDVSIHKIISSYIYKNGNPFDQWLC